MQRGGERSRYRAVDLVSGSRWRSNEAGRPYLIAPMARATMVSAGDDRHRGAPALRIPSCENPGALVMSLQALATRTRMKEPTLKLLETPSREPCWNT